MIKIFYITKEAAHYNIYKYSVLSAFTDEKKAQRAFIKECKKVSNGRFSGKNIWQSKNGKEKETVYLKKSSLPIDVIPKTIYIRRETKTLHGKKIVLEEVNANSFDGGIPVTLQGNLCINEKINFVLYISFFILFSSLFLIPYIGKFLTGIVMYCWNLMFFYLILYSVYLCYSEQSENFFSFKRK